jgi:hypothetical protein
MVAFSGADPVGVLIGAKRPSATLVHKIAVHPDYRRQGHGHHLLESLGSKLAILGPPRIVAEVPETFAPAHGLFRASGYVEESVLTDYVLSEAPSTGEVGLVIPVTVDDLAANGLLGGEGRAACWERSVETLTARKDEIAGLAVASEDRLEAAILYIKDGEIVWLRSLVGDDGARLRGLLARMCAEGLQNLTFPKVHPAEMSGESLERLGFRPAGMHRVYAARARAN